jgi:hypothetical protein
VIDTQLPVIALFALLKVALAFPPNEVTTVMHATRIKAIITRYSTAVAPSLLSMSRGGRAGFVSIGSLLVSERFESGFGQRSLWCIERGSGSVLNQVPVTVAFTLLKV